MNKSLTDYLEKNKDSIAKKVTAKEIEVVNNIFEQQNDYIYGKMTLCPNNKCFASLKSKLVNKIQKTKNLKCSYCNEPINAKDIISIVFHFKKI